MADPCRGERAIGARVDAIAAGAMRDRRKAEAHAERIGERLEVLGLGGKVGALCVQHFQEVELAVFKPDSGRVVGTLGPR